MRRSEDEALEGPECTQRTSKMSEGQGRLEAGGADRKESIAGSGAERVEGEVHGVPKGTEEASE